MMKRNMITVSVSSLLWLLTGCTKNFEEINKNPFGFGEEELQGDYQLMAQPLMQAQMNLLIYNDPPNAQLQQNLNADVYSGYMMSPNPFEGNINNTNYGLIYYWNNVPWTFTYNKVFKPCRFAQEKTGENRHSDFYAWAQILKVEAMHRLSDIYGPIIYSKYKLLSDDQSFDYDSQKEVYYTFFRELDEAIGVLTDSVRGRAVQKFGHFDKVYHNNYTQWVKFANTLRLRLAIRISGVEPEKARQEGEAALRHPFGLLIDNRDNFAVDITPVNHPLNVMSYSWADLRMGAPMESILTGYHDPRLPHYFLPTDRANSVYNGIRNGIYIGSREMYNDFSMLAPLESKIQFMTAAEAWFLKAEAALNGWSGAGSAGENYNRGIFTSLQQYGEEAKAAAYINDHYSKPRPYTDPLNPENNITADSPWLSRITIKWEETVPREKKLERIITQKWIAMFPEGAEAWAEFRRTGFPVLFPVVINNSGGTIDTKKFIRRLPLPRIEYTTNLKAVQRAVLTLKGADNGGTPLWWDTRQ